METMKIMYTLGRFLALALVAAPIASIAGTYVWAGGSDGRWNNPLSYEGGTAGGVHHTVVDPHVGGK